MMAVEAKSADRLHHLYALAETLPEARRGVTAAFGWVERDQLRGIVSALLASPNAFLRLLGLTACAMHRVDPGQARDAALEGPVPALRNRALRTAGELGRRELIPTCLEMLKSDDPETRFWAAWSAVLLGNRGRALERLGEIGSSPGPFQARAFRLSLQAMQAGDVHLALRRLSGNPDDLRSLIQGSGIAGDPVYLPWLIGQMSDPQTARLAGEAFSVMTGLDLAYLDLDRKPPEAGGAGPTDDPDDSRVGIDLDDGLPWPDAGKISQWWQGNGARFVQGSRYFLGAPVTRESCVRAMKEGFQRQRILAAHYLCLMEPGSTLFEWRAPAPRQQRVLAAMA